MSLCWMQNASQEDHDAIAAGAQLLKKLCRIKTNLSWKEWRVTMEAQWNASLQVEDYLASKLDTYSSEVKQRGAS